MSSKQQGGVVNFVVVTVVLTGLLLGGLYLSKHVARIAHDTNTSQPQVANQPDKAPEQQPSSNSGTQTPQSQSQSHPQQPSTSAPQTANPQSQTPAPAKPSQNGAVPATGPTETFAGMLMLGVLTYVSVRYVQSRSPLRAAARK